MNFNTSNHSSSEDRKREDDLEEGELPPFTGKLHYTWCTCEECKSMSQPLVRQIEPIQLSSYNWNKAFLQENRLILIATLQSVNDCFLHVKNPAIFQSCMYDIMWHLFSVCEMTRAENDIYEYFKALNTEFVELENQPPFETQPAVAQNIIPPTTNETKPTTTTNVNLDLGALSLGDGGVSSRLVYEDEKICVTVKKMYSKSKPIPPIAAEIDSSSMDEIKPVPLKSNISMEPFVLEQTPKSRGCNNELTNARWSANFNAALSAQGWLDKEFEGVPLEENEGHTKL